MFNLIRGDCLKRLTELPENSFNCCVTSPPYFGLRDYGMVDQFGSEKSPDEFVDNLVRVFREIRRVLRGDGTLWLNLGDCYAGRRQSVGQTDSRRRDNAVIPRSDRKYPGIKPKDLVGIPWMVAFALRQDGWYLRSEIIWHKPNPMPESVNDRPTKAHETIFLFSKNEKYFYDHKAICEPCQTNAKENYPGRSKVIGRGGQGSAKARGNDRDKSGGFPPRKREVYTGQDTKDYAASGAQSPSDSKRRILAAMEKNGYVRNKRSVWTVTTKPFKGAHFATFPKELIRPCILAGCPVGGRVIDPFSGAGTTGVVCVEEGRKYTGIELNPDYLGMSRVRIADALYEAVIR